MSKKNLIIQACNCIENSFLNYKDKQNELLKVQSMKPKELKKTISNYETMFLNDYNTRCRKIQGF